MNDKIFERQDKQIENLTNAIEAKEKAIRTQAQAEMLKLAVEGDRVKVLRKISETLDDLSMQSGVILQDVQTIRALLHGTGDSSAKIDAIVAFISFAAGRMDGGSEINRLSYLLERAIGERNMSGSGVDLKIDTGGGKIDQVAGQVSGDMEHGMLDTAIVSVIADMKEMIEKSIETGDWEKAEVGLNTLPGDTLDVVLTALTKGSLAGLVNGAKVMVQLVQGKYKFIKK